MTALILDAGALLAVDRDDRAMIARLRVAQHSGLELRSNAMVVAQVWRDRRGRQVNLACLLAAMRRLALGEAVTNVALDLGYESPAAFTTMFKKSLGMPPSRYFSTGANRSFAGDAA